jgi:DNA topoisomerase-1
MPRGYGNGDVDDDEKAWLADQIAKGNTLGQTSGGGHHVAKKPVAKKPVVKKPVVKKPVVKKATVKKATVKKPVVKKATVKK